MPVPCAACNTSCPTACATICDAVCDRSSPAIPPVPPTPPIPPPEPSPLTIMAGSIVAGWDAASLSSSPVASWPDLGPGGFTLTAVGAAQPTWSATGGPNSEPSVLFDGANDVMSNALLDRPAPGTQVSFFWGVLRAVTWGPADSFWSAGVGASFLRVFQASGSPNTLQANQVFGNLHGGFTLGSYKRFEALFSNSTSDYVKAGAFAPSTGTNTGNDDPAAGFQIAAAPNIASFGNIEVCEFWIFSAEPSPAQKAALDAYVTARYGPGLI
jgi:hypothetical protein